MTIRINKPALNLREELTKAQGVVRYEQRQFWMDGLVENGTFDSDVSGWTANSTNLSVVGGKLRVQNSTSTYGNAVTPITLKVGKRYIMKFDFTKSTHDAVVAFNTSSSGGSGTRKAFFTVSSSGSYTLAWTADTADMYVAATVNTNISGVYFEIDNVAVFEVDENDEVIHSLPLGFKPLHVYEDGLIQREGDVHDYTVVKTGGAYAIKPTVQPTATTETCIIAEREL